MPQGSAAAGTIATPAALWTDDLVFDPARAGTGVRGMAGENARRPPAHEDLVLRQFRADGPNRLWLWDITEHPTSLAGSMGQVASAGDNAAMESFFSLLQKNVLNRRRWATRHELRLAIITWIERTYHRRRRQARLGRLTPIEFETIMTTQVDAVTYSCSRPYVVAEVPSCTVEHDSPSGSRRFRDLPDAAQLVKTWHEQECLKKLLSSRCWSTRVQDSGSAISRLAPAAASQVRTSALERDRRFQPGCASRWVRRREQPHDRAGGRRGQCKDRVDDR